MQVCDYSLFLELHDLLLEGVGLGEAEGDFMGGHLVVDLSEGVKLVLHFLLIEGVEEHSDVLLSIKTNSG